MPIAVETVNLEDARRIIAAAEKKAAEIGQPMNIAVADAGGNLVSHVRMDGAWIGSIDISIKGLHGARVRHRDRTARQKQSAGPAVLWHSRIQSRARHDLRGRHSVAAQWGGHRRYRGQRRRWQARPDGRHGWSYGVFELSACLRSVGMSRR